MLKTTLGNGLQVIVQENHAAKVVSIQVWVRVGSADELPPEAGLAHVHEHMLFKGTERRGVGAIAAEIEGAGGEINAYTSYDQTVYYVTMASREFATGLDILSDAVLHSSFDSEELTRELEVVLEEVRRDQDTPARVVGQNLFKHAFQVHPYCRPIIGYVETIKSFNRAMITDFYKKWYRPSNMVLVVVGDVAEQEVLGQAEKLFQTERTGPIPARPRPPEPAQKGVRIIRQAQDIQETYLSFGWHGLPFQHDDTAALDILSTVLGSGESSRLYRTVKRDKQLVNDCYAYNYTPLDRGLMMVGGNVHGPEIEAAFRELLREAYRLRFVEPTPAELEKAKTILLSEAVYEKETVQGIARKLGFYELMAGGSNYEDVYYGQIRETTAEDVRRVAEKYLVNETLSVSVLLPTTFEAKLSETEIERSAREVMAELVREYHPPTFELGPEQVAKVKLSSGATLLVREDRAVPLVSVRAATQGGLLHETDKTNGITHLLGELITRGTRQYSAEQISEATDAMAGSLSGVSGRNSIGLAGTFLHESWDRGIDLFASCLLEATFEKSEFEREQKTQIEDIASRQDELSAVCFEQLAGGLWQHHPYRMPLLGTEKSVSGLTRDDVVQAYRSALHPERLTFAVVGAVDVARTIEQFERRFGAPALKLEKAAPLPAPSVEPPLETPRTFKTTRPKEQAHLAFGFHGVSVFDDRNRVLEVLACILAGQSGRLFLELRDRQSLAYSVSAFNVAGLHPGYFAVYIGTAGDKVQQAERGLRDELNKLIRERVAQQELDRAKRYLIGSHEISLQRMGARSFNMALSEAYGLGYDEYVRYAQEIERVTADRLFEVAREVIRFDRMVYSLVDVGANA